jgi:predicted RNA-binding Zn ribbon-like protein
VTPRATETSSFKYVAGEPCLDFVNTVDWTETGTEGERLHSFADVVRWARGAELLAPGEARRAADLAKRDPEAADRAYAAALELRRVLKRTFTGLATRQRAAEAPLGEFNGWLREAVKGLRVVARGPGFEWSWSAGEDDPMGVLWPVVWSAAGLLTSPEIRRLKLCAGDRCGWLFVDRSRNRRRRWCEMEVCGNRAKARRHYARQRRGS